LGVMVMGWSGPGSFMVVSLFGQPDVIGGFDPAALQGWDREYSATEGDVEGRPR
jgi:hypothetical protein